MTLALMLTALLMQATGAPLPSPTSACPATGVMRITPNGLVPSVHYVSQSTQASQPGQPVTVQQLWAYVLILVDVDANGSVKGVRLLHSGGPAWDSRMRHEARTSRYKPKMVGCRAVEGTFYFFVPIAGG